MLCLYYIYHNRRGRLPINQVYKSDGLWAALKSMVGIHPVMKALYGESTQRFAAQFPEVNLLP
jgi:hypothetical protein